MRLGRPQRLDPEGLGSVLGFERPIVLYRHRISGEPLEPDLAAPSVGGADLGHTDTLGHGRLRRQLAGAAAFAAAAAAALAAAAAFSASSFMILRCLRGIARVGLLRFSRFMRPASSRKRATRSV